MQPPSRASPLGHAAARRAPGSPHLPPPGAAAAQPGPGAAPAPLARPAPPPAAPRAGAEEDGRGRREQRGGAERRRPRHCGKCKASPVPPRPLAPRGARSPPALPRRPSPPSAAAGSALPAPQRGAPAALCLTPSGGTLACRAPRRSPLGQVPTPRPPTAPACPLTSFPPPEPPREGPRLLRAPPAGTGALTLLSPLPPQPPCPALLGLPRGIGPARPGPGRPAGCGAKGRARPPGERQAGRPAPRPRRAFVLCRGNTALNYPERRLWLCLCNSDRDSRYQALTEMHGGPEDAAALSQQLPGCPVLCGGKNPQLWQ